jgi:dihydroxyacetone kinase
MSSSNNSKNSSSSSSSRKPKQILNDPTKSVDEFISGLLLQYPNRLQKLENHNVVLTSTPPCDGNVVQLLSGGGSGHEPSHAGWIGHGMLSGAICGGIFASPSVSSILAGIRAADVTLNKNNKNNTTGILLIVKNYTGDRLNFGMACEKANQEGVNCQLVVVAGKLIFDISIGFYIALFILNTDKFFSFYCI